MLKIQLPRLNRPLNHSNKPAAVLSLVILVALGGIAVQSLILDSEVRTGDDEFVDTPAVDQTSVWTHDQIEPLSTVNKEKVSEFEQEPKPLETTTTGYDNFQSLLASYDFESVIEIYDQIYTDFSIEVSAKYRELLLDRASDLIQGNDLTRAIALLNEYLTIYYSDVDALIMLGRAYRDFGSKFEAIKSLQHAYQHEHRAGVSTLILNQANTVIGEYVQELKDTNNQQTIVDVYLWLTQAQPDVAGYYIGLANAYTDQQRYVEAIDALRYVQHDFKVGPRARMMLNKLINRKATPDNS